MLTNNAEETSHVLTAVYDTITLAFCRLKQITESGISHAISHAISHGISHGISLSISLSTSHAISHS